MDDVVVRRAGSAHEEWLRSGRSWCAVCGYLDEIDVPSEINLRYHGDSFTEDGIPIAVQAEYDAAHGKAEASPDPIVVPFVDERTRRRSEAITMHDQVACALCKGASAQQDDHYALGALRLQIARRLGLTRDAARQLDLRTLLDRASKQAADA